jgi:hypothetical protein
MIEHATLLKHYKYDPENGEFYHANGVACSTFPNEKGYLLLAINRKHYRVHRLAWFYMTSEWPEYQIDHDNNLKYDNRWLNLRKANNQLNHYNLLKPKNNTSGAKGVRKLKNGKYSARIKYNKKEIHLGTYDSLELASDAYFNKAKLLANEFANPG